MTTPSFDAPTVIEVGDTGQVLSIPIGEAIVVEGVQIPASPGARKLDDLDDVENASSALAGRVLIKQFDGIWRPGSVEGGTGTSQVVYSQPTPAASWLIEHNLGHYPQVTVLDEVGQRLLPDLEYGSLDAVTVTHAEPLAGIAILT